MITAGPTQAGRRDRQHLRGGGDRNGLRVAVRQVGHDLPGLILEPSQGFGVREPVRAHPTIAVVAKLAAEKCL